MKLKIYKTILLGVFAIVGLASCEDYFDNAPDNEKTIETVFKSEKDTHRFLANVYSYIRPIYQWSNESIFTGISDELDVTYSDYEVSKINLGLLSPDKEGLYYGNHWTHYYAGIRAATVFMQNVDKCEELIVYTDGKITSDIRERMKLEARALRAWFYFNLIKQYGPVVIMPEQLKAGDTPVSEMQYARKPIKECFNYVVSELDSVLYYNERITISNSKLKPLQTTAASADNTYGDLDRGRINEAMCKALKARTLLYAASDFYNRDRTLSIFKDFKNIDNEYMFNYTDADRQKLLLDAKKATEELFEYPLSLFKTKGPLGDFDPYESLKKLYFGNDTQYNSEIIYAKPEGKFWEQDRACSPRFVSGWSGWGATQEAVDAFFTKTGYPLLKDSNGKLYAQDNSYVEEGFSQSAGDDGYTQSGTYKMYTNREPRFYVAITFNNSKWLAKMNNTTVQMYYGGNTGRTEKESRNYSQTGYLARKFVNPESDVSKDNGLVESSAVYFRLAEFYLNYAEILNEIDYSANLSTTLDYLNKIRTRAGIPVYGNSAGNVPIPANYEAMREAIRRERRVELVFEEHRYFDCVRWGIAHQYFGGDKHGMNANDSRGESVFHQRTLLETRKYEDFNLLWPIPQSDIYKGKLLVQNPKWSTITSSQVGE